MELHKPTNERPGHHSSITHVHLIFLKKLCSSSVFAVSFTFSLFIEWGDAEKFWLFCDNYMDNQLIFLSVIITPYSLWIKNPVVITARKRSLKQGNVFTGVCLSTGAGVGFPACTRGSASGVSANRRVGGGLHPGRSTYRVGGLGRPPSRN